MDCLIYLLLPRLLLVFCAGGIQIVGSAHVNEVEPQLMESADGVDPRLSASLQPYQSTVLDIILVQYTFLPHAPPHTETPRHGDLGEENYTYVSNLFSCKFVLQN